jgi:hypothetical protein
VAGRSTAVVTCAAGRAGSNLGILPLDGPLPLAMGNPFNLMDGRLVVVEDWHAEPWLDDAETSALYRRLGTPSPSPPSSARTRGR